ncbi:hypothetical protein GCM10023238_22740 [Streptomyces heliomycini]
MGRAQWNGENTDCWDGAVDQFTPTTRLTAEEVSALYDGEKR